MMKISVRELILIFNYDFKLLKIRMLVERLLDS